MHLIFCTQANILRILSNVYVCNTYAVSQWKIKFWNMKKLSALFLLIFASVSRVDTIHDRESSTSYLRFPTV